ncbi:hypothetical protein AB1Y20_002265 [Prymnesium parvum]|uniref:F-box domain-containing protein n=1 Tax=Prymnesium parvum TaxID=97485 RepID=A0AB34J816_PRYPA
MDGGSLASLPADLLPLVARHLDARSLGRLTCTNRHLAGLLAEDDAWLPLFHRLSRQLPPAGVPPRAALRSLTALSDARWTPLARSPPHRHAGFEPRRHSPVWREHACLVACEGGRALVLFGGRGEFGFYDDSWRCELTPGGARWERVAERGARPRPRCFNSDGGGGRVLRCGAEEWLVLFGGLCEEGYRDAQTWLLGPLGATPSAWRWHRLPAGSRREPAPCFHHSLTVASAEGADVLCLMGGHNWQLQPISHLYLLALEGATLERAAEPAGEPRWRFEKVRWRRQPSDGGPPARGFHSAAYWLAPGGVEYLVVSCGAKGPLSEPFADTWLFDLRAGVWRELAAILPHKCSHAASAIVRHKLVLCGGIHDKELGTRWVVSNEVWLLDLEACLRGGGAWERCAPLPEEHPVRQPYASASAFALFGGSCLLVLGGHSGVCDHFGDGAVGEAWALHESQLIAGGEGGFSPPSASRLVEADPVTLPSASRLVAADPVTLNADMPYREIPTAGLELLQPSPDQHGELNGSTAYADELLLSEAEGPDRLAVVLQRRNLLYSKGAAPAVASFGDTIFALTPAYMLESNAPVGLNVSKLCIFPRDADEGSTSRA